MAKTYYSPFFPPQENSGAKGSTIPIVSSGTVSEIITDVDQIKQELEVIGPGGDYTPPAIVTGLTLSSTIALDNTGSQIVTLKAEWTASASTDIGGYVLAIKEGSGGFVEFTAGPSSTLYTWSVRAGQAFTVKIKAFDKWGNFSGFSPEVSTVSATDTVPPAVPTTLSADVSLGAATLRWNNPSDGDLVKINIYENSVNNSSTATFYATVNAEPAGKGSYTRTGLNAGSVKWFFLKAVDSSGNQSNYTTGLQVTVPSLSETDFTPTASGIAPLNIVTSLPSTGNYFGRVVFLRSDGKLYRWNSTTTSGLAFWTSEVPTEDLVGTIGTDKLADGSVSAAKFDAGVAPVERVASNPTTGNIVGRVVFNTTDGKIYRYTSSGWTSATSAGDITGQLSGSQIADLAISAAKFANNLTAIELVSSLPTAGNFPGRTVFNTTNSKLYKYDGTTFTANIPSADISGQITDEQIASLPTSKLTGTVAANQLTANSIGASKLLLAGENLWPDSQVQDIEWWKGPSQGTLLESGRVEPTNNNNTPANGWYLVSNASDADTAALPGSRGMWILWSGDGSTTGYTGATQTQLVPPSLMTKAETAYEFAIAVSNSSNRTLQVNIQYFNNTGTMLSSGTILSVLPGDTSPLLRRLQFTTPANCASVRIYWRTPGGSTYSGILRVANVNLREAAGGTLIVEGSIVGSKIAAEAISTDKIEANAITTGLIQAGAVTTDQLAAKSVSASKMFIGDTSNMYPDPNQVDIKILNIGQALAAYTLPISGAFASSHAVAIPSHLNRQEIYGAYIEVEPNKEYYFSIVASMLIADGGSAEVRVDWLSYNSASDTYTYKKTDVLQINSTTTQERKANQFKAPIDANRVRINYFRNGGGTSSALFIEPIVRRATSGELIVGGSVSTDKLAANSVTASRMFIGDTSNMIPDPTCSDLDSWTGVNLSTAPTDFTSPSTHRLVTLVNNSDDFITSTQINVEGDRDYYFNVGVGSGTGSNVSTRAYVNWYSMDSFGNLTFISNNDILPAAFSTINRRGEKIIKSPTDARVAFIRGQKYAGATPGSLVLFGPIMRRASSGELIVEGSITSDKILAGEVKAGNLAAGAVTTSKLLVTPVSLCPDPYFYDTDYWSSPWDANGWYAESNPADLWATRYVALWSDHPTNSPGTLIKIIRSKPISSPASGTVLRFKSNINNSSNQTINIAIRFLNSTNTEISNFVISAAAGSDQSTPNDQVTVPTGAVQMQFVVYNQGSTGFVGLARVSGIMVDVAGSGDMIVNGAITTDKIFANSITSGLIQAGAVSTEELAAGAVVASKLAIRGENLWPDSLVQDISWWKGPSQGTSPDPGSVVPVNDDNTDSAGWSLKTSGVTAYPTRTGGSKGVWQLWSGNSNDRFTSSAEAKIIPPSLMAKSNTTYEFSVGCWNSSNKVVYYTVQEFNASGSIIKEVVLGSTAIGATAIERFKYKTDALCVSLRFITSVPASVNFSGAINIGNFTLREAASGTMIVDGSITAQHITAEKLVGDDVIANNSLSGSIIKTTTSLPGTITVGTTGVTIQTIESRAANPATTINANSTLIDPGKILVSGGTTLASWRNGADNTKIEGGNIAANTIRANSIQIGSRGIDIQGIEFEANKPSANRCAWSSGVISYTDDSNTPVSISIDAGNVGTTTPGTPRYIYWIKGNTTLFNTTSYGTANGANNVVIATYNGGVDLVVNYGRTIISGSQITTGSITASQLATTTLITTSAQIGDAVITNAKIGNLEVDTLKIAGGSIGVPLVIVGVQKLVGSFQTSIVETGWLTIGDAYGGSAIIIFNAQQDSGGTQDKLVNYVMQIDHDDGLGYINVYDQNFGARTNGGDTNSKLNAGLIYAVDNTARVRVKVSAQSQDYFNGSPSGNWTINSPTVVVFGAKR